MNAAPHESRTKVSPITVPLGREQTKMSSPTGHCPILGTAAGARRAEAAAVAVAGRAGADLGLRRGLGRGGQGQGSEDLRPRPTSRELESPSPPRTRRHERRVVVFPLHLGDHAIHRPVASWPRRATATSCRKASRSPIANGSAARSTAASWSSVRRSGPSGIGAGAESGAAVGVAPAAVATVTGDGCRQ